MTSTFPEQFQRTRLLVGDAAMARLQAAHVTIVGLGAVGSYAVEGLARAGVGHLRLIDFDCVDPTNINRQLYALHSTIGQPKFELAAARVHDINPQCDVESMRLFVSEDTLEEALTPRPDILIDAIDSLNAKVSLLAACLDADIHVLASMGAARRTDPARIHIADIAETRNCPLAKVVRKRLRRRGIEKGLTCVYSDEIAAEPPADAPEAVPAVGSHALDGRRGRARSPMGSLSVITGIFGLMLAREAIQKIITE